MNRQQYKAAMQWLRFAARETHKKIDYKALNKAIDNMMVYGHGVYKCQT